MRSIKYFSYLVGSLQSPSMKDFSCFDVNKVSSLVAIGQENGSILISSIKMENVLVCQYELREFIILNHHKAAISSISWNERFNKFVSGDVNGMVILWNERDGKFSPCMVNDNIKSKVISTAFSFCGELCGIAFQDGTIMCFDMNGVQKWQKKHENTPEHIFWSQLPKDLYVSSSTGVFCYRTQGKTVESIKIEQINGDIISNLSSWNPKTSELITGNINGEIHIYSSPISDNNIKTFNTHFHPVTCVWMDNRVLIIGSIDSVFELRIYELSGNMVHSFGIHGVPNGEIRTNKNGSQIFVLMKDSLNVYQLIPNPNWCYLANTLVYSFSDNSSPENMIVFFNRKTASRYVKSVSNVIGLTASTTKVLLASKIDENNTSLMLLNNLGIPTTNCFIQMSPHLFYKTENMSFALSSKQLCIWDNINDSISFQNLSKNPTSVFANNEYIYIGYHNEIICYSIKEFKEQSHYSLLASPIRIQLSSDSSRISIIDNKGSLVFIDVHSGQVIENVRNEVWDVIWASDSPSLFACLSQQKHTVYHNFNIEESRMSLSCFCEFSQMEVVSIDLISLFTEPRNPSIDHFSSYEVKPLRDTRILLSIVPHISYDEIIQYIRSRNHHKLWSILAEHSMRTLNFTVSQQAFIESQNSFGQLLLQKILSIKKNPKAREGYVYWYLNQYDNAEKCFLEVNYRSQVVDMWSSSGNWKRAIENLETTNTERMKQLYSCLGKQQYSNGEWLKAADSFGKSGDFQSQLNSLLQADDFTGIYRLLQSLPYDSPIIREIGMRFVSIGSYEKAVEAFIKCNDSEMAIKSCILLNQWNKALELASQYNTIDKKEVMKAYSQYLAENSQTGKAIKLFIRFNHKQEAAALLDSEGDFQFNVSKNFVKAKQCYVYASMLFDETRSLVEWQKAEALHFFLLSHRYLYNGEYKKALFVANRLVKSYSHVIGIEKCASLLVLSSFYSSFFSQCSKGMVILENFPKFSKPKQKRMQMLGVKIFGKNPPNDQTKFDTWKCPKCERLVSEIETKCECGYVPMFCIVTGKPIVSQQKWKCKKCSHYVLSSEVSGLNVCPLCHSSIRSKTKKRVSK